MIGRGCRAVTSTTALPNFLRASASFWGLQDSTGSMYLREPGAGTEKVTPGLRGKRFPPLPTGSGLHFFAGSTWLRTRDLGEEVQPPGTLQNRSWADLRSPACPRSPWRLESQAEQGDIAHLRSQVNREPRMAESLSSPWGRVELGEPRTVRKPLVVDESRAALESPSRSAGGPVSAGSPSLSTPEPRPAASRPLTGPRGCPSSPARPGHRLAGVPAHRPDPARPLSVPSYLAGSRDSGGAAPQVPVPHFPVLHAAVRPNRAAAAAASGLRPHPPGSTRQQRRLWRRRQRRRQLPLRTAPTSPKPEMAAAPLPIPGPAVTRGRGHPRRRGSPKPGRRRVIWGRSLLAIGQSKGERGGSHADPGESRAREKRLADIKGTSSGELDTWAFDWSPNQVVGGALPPIGPDWEVGEARKEVAN